MIIQLGSGEYLILSNSKIGVEVRVLREFRMQNCGDGGLGCLE